MFNKIAAVSVTALGVLSALTNATPTGISPEHADNGLSLFRRTENYPACVDFVPSEKELYVGDHATGKVVKYTLNEDKTAVMVTYPKIDDSTTYESVGVWLSYKPPTSSNMEDTSYTSTNGNCTISPNGCTSTCTVPLVGSLLQESGWPLRKRTPGCSTLCSDDRTFYTVTYAQVKITTPEGVTEACAGAADAGSTLCLEKDAAGACIGPYRYWTFKVHCEVPTPTPSPSSSSTPATSTSMSESSTSTPKSIPSACSSGTGYGYNSDARTFDSMRPLPQTCKKWGWYITTRGATLTSSGVSGHIYVGAGNNDISKATDAGTFTIVASSSDVVVTYSFFNGFTTGSVHVYASCAIQRSCAPGSYNYNKAVSPASGTAEVRVPREELAACWSSGTIYFILHADVNAQCPA